MQKRDQNLMSGNWELRCNGLLKRPVQTNLDASRVNVVEKEGAYLSAVADLGFQSGCILEGPGREE